MYPTVTNLTNALSAMGVSVPSFITSGAVEASIIQFEQQTGRIPFIAASGNVTYTMSPEGARSNWRNSYGGSPYLMLSTNMISVSAVIIDGVTQSVSAYSFYPLDYQLKNRPIEGIVFDTAPYTDRGEITIIGKPGYSATCPQDVYQAILINAVGYCQKMNTYLQMGGLNSIKEADLSMDFGSGGATGNMMISPMLQSVITSYRRII